MITQNTYHFVKLFDKIYRTSHEELHLQFSYLKSTRGKKTPDFLLQRDGSDLVLEIGGKGKGREQFKDLAATDKIRFVHSDESVGNKRPLFMLGYMTP